MKPTPENVRTAGYKEQLRKLPERVQKIADVAFRMFQVNPAHPALRLHALTDNKRGQQRVNSFSVTISMQYRAICVRDGSTNVWYWIGSHNDYERFTGEK